MSAIRAKLVARARRHPLFVISALLGAGALLCWAGYRGTLYYEARSHYRAAQELVERREWKSALEHLDEAQRLAPDRPANHLLAARAERRLENLDRAKRHLDTCERLQGGETQPVKVERALLRVHQGDLAGAEEFLRACIQQDDPDAVEILDILAAALEINYRDAEAQRCLDDLLQRRPEHFDALVRRGRTAKSMGWFQDAVAYYEKALAVRPDVDSVRLALAEIQVVLGHFDPARKHFEQLRERQPRNPSVLFGLARCAAGAGANEQALTLFNQLLAANPDDWMVLTERGWLAVQLDRPRDGEVDLRRADSLAPPHVPPTHLVNCLRLLGKADEARKYQEKVDRIQTDNKRAAELGGLIREKTPDDPEPRYELGRILLRQGKARDAVHWFETALAKAPAHRKTHEALAEFYQSVRAVERAEHHRRVLQGLSASAPN
ncbi:tetratricopeptide repeat protein [Gemmata sp. G18]|uniref:Tetratricopeptide repeat protein n=1 Tax=Gemmata palustris TaxID=2822762 RepID=A0ABS5BLK1_9BACT|nr:tetratricopeptide repeat protein [Gemmata palustris]MBP3954574.1 tetratricopeptide repeat protein [Gemmata palustris]